MFRNQIFGSNEQIYIVSYIALIGLTSIVIFIKYILIGQVPFPKGYVLYQLLIVYMLFSFIYLKYKFMLFSGLSLIIVYIAVLLLAEYISFRHLFWDIYHYYSLGIVFLCMVLDTVEHLKFIGVTFVDNRFGWIMYKDSTISDPNYFAVFIGLAMIYFYSIFSNRGEKGLRRLNHLALFITLCFFLIITLSRGVVFSFIFTLLFVSVIKEWGKIKFVLISCIIPITMFIGWILLFKFGRGNIQNVNYFTIDRFLLINSSERLEVWTKLFDGFINSGFLTVLIGNGFQSGSSLGAKFYFGVEPHSNGLIFKNPHNMYLQSLVEIGIFGILILLSLSLMFIWQTFQCFKQKNYIPFSLLLFFCSVNFSLNIMGFREQAFIFGILLLTSLRIKEEPN
jgi:hypothetical protein